MNITLTKGERIMVGRRRDGYTQGDFARAEGVSQSLISRWESGIIDAPPPVQRRYSALGRLTRGERALVLRRRLGYGVRYAAARYGCSHFHLIRMESGEKDASEYLKWIEERYENWTGKGKTGRKSA